MTVRHTFRLIARRQAARAAARPGVRRGEGGLWSRAV
jgi:hypothetical protein